MNTLKATFVFEGESTVRSCAVIFHEDKPWLVPYWRDNPQKGYSRPERIVLLETIPHQTSDGKLHDFLINAPIPKAVFAGLPYVQKDVVFVVKEDPDIFFPYKAGLT